MIRLATYEDAATIGQLWLQMIQYHRLLDTAMPEASVDGALQYQRRIESRLTDSSTRILVAEIDGEVIGYVLGMVVDLVPEMFTAMYGGFIADIYVSTDYRRRGIARALVERMALWFLSKGITYFEWHVAYTNKDAVAFWEAIGGRTVMLRMRTDIGDES